MGTTDDGKFGYGCDAATGELVWIEVNDSRGHVKLTAGELLGMVHVREQSNAFQAYLDERAGDPPTQQEIASAMTFVERLDARTLALLIAREHRYSGRLKERPAQPFGFEEEGLIGAIEFLCAILTASSRREDPAWAGVNDDAKAAMRNLIDRLGSATPPEQQVRFREILLRCARDGRTAYLKRLGLPLDDIVLTPDPVTIDSLGLAASAAAQRGEEAPRG